MKKDFLEKVPLGKGVKVIAQDPCGLFALDKPAGVKSHPNKPGIDPLSVIKAPYDMKEECYLLENGEKIYLLNRLDSPTSGVILLSGNREVAAIVKKLFKERKVTKEYLAVVKGGPGNNKMVWKDMLSKEKRGDQVRVMEGEDLTAETEVEVVERITGTPKLTLLKLTPKTGRTHQLRIQSAKRKMPIIGDKTYGDFGLNRVMGQKLGTKRLFLHSSRTMLSFEYGGNLVIFKAETGIPEEFNRLIKGEL